MRTLEAGTKIICQSCKAHVATTAFDIEEGELLTGALFNFEPGFEVKEHSPFNCAGCGVNLGNKRNFYHQIPTEHGWWP